MKELLLSIGLIFWLFVIIYGILQLLIPVFIYLSYKRLTEIRNLLHRNNNNRLRQRR